MKPGIKSSEFAGIAAVVLMGAAKLFGIVPQDATAETVGQQALDTIPLLINSLTMLARENSAILIPAGLAWAYLRRRTALKQQQMKQVRQNE